MTTAVANRLSSTLVEPRLTIPAHRLKELRLRRGFEREQLANDSKVSVYRIRQIEQATKRAATVKPDTARKLAMALRVNFEDLTEVVYDDD